MLYFYEGSLMDEFATIDAAPTAAFEAPMPAPAAFEPIVPVESSLEDFDWDGFYTR